MINTELDIRSMTADDWPSVKTIYREGIDTGMATFETEVPEWEKWDESHLNHSRLVAGHEESIVGWAALSSVSDRCVYGGVAEISVYVSEHVLGRGVGTALLKALVANAEENGIWTLQAGIFPENKASFKIHEKCGFRIVGKRESWGACTEHGKM